MKPLRRPRDVLHDWIGELSAHLGRSVEALARNGLIATDFQRCVEVRTPYGMTVKFELAFYLVREAVAQAVVFTEHSGYVEFDMVDDMVFVTISEEVYRYDSAVAEPANRVESR